MKRLICLLLMCSLCMAGCSVAGEWIKEPVTFYYVCETYQKDMESVIASEIREASGHRDDLPYLLALYTMGPSTEDLKSPLPRNTKIILTEYTDSSVVLSISESASTINDADFTLASACIALTCMELVDAQQITVICGDRNITIQADNLLLHDNLVDQSQEETN